MFGDYENAPPEEPTDYSGLIIALAVLPVFILFICLGKPDMGFTVFLVLGLTLLAMKLNWKLRKHVWFWASIAFVFLLHVPLFFIVRWPHTKTPTIVYMKPLGIVDFFLMAGAIKLAEKIFSKGSSSDDDE